MTDVNFINAYNEVILDNFNSVLKQNFMFQTQIKFLQEQVNELDSLREKAIKYDDLMHEKDNCLHQIDVLKDDIQTKDRLIESANNADADRHRLQTALNTQAQEIEKLKTRIGNFEDEIKSKTEYVKQLEDMLPNSKRKKLGLEPIDTPKEDVEEIKVTDKTPKQNNVSLKEIANGGSF